MASRDGRFIYFAARPMRFSYDPKTAGGLWQIERFDRTTGERSTIAGGIGGAARPALSPDGATMVYISRRDADTVLVARTLATGAERLLARSLSRDDQEGFAAMDVWPNYAFTPGRQRAHLQQRRPPPEAVTHRWRDTGGGPGQDPGRQSRWRQR